jgi:hypothetical protein
MPFRLDYASKRPGGSLALSALIIGVCSGPAALGLGLLVSASHLGEAGRLTSLAVVFCGAVVFCCVARSRLPSDATPRQRKMARAGIAATIAWSAAIVVLKYALSPI